MKHFFLFSENQPNFDDCFILFITVLAAVWFDDGASKALNALLKAGIIDLLASDDISDDPDELNGKPRAPLVAPPVSDGYPVHRLQDRFFAGLTLLAWTVQLGKPKALAFFARRGYKVTVPVDMHGNLALHYVAMYGTAEMAELVLAEKAMRLEQTNNAGYTAGMLVAKYGNCRVAKKLFECKVDCRRSLEGCYAGWVLAFVRRRERNERNLQTGRYGEDDVNYFSIAPDPFYVTWYAV